MRRFFLFALGVLSASVSNAQDYPIYNTILGVNDSVTGVRGTDTTDTGNVLVTGSQIIGGAPQTLLWQGNLYTGAGSFYNIIPVESGTVTSSNFYGPDTPAFNSSIPNGQVRAVGTYQTDNSGTTRGFMYTGPLASGTFAVTNIDVPGAANTVPHSTAGNIVVGDYDTGAPSTGNAFIYSIATGTYQTLSIGSGATLYGVWQTGSDTYVVAGGATNPDDPTPGSQAFLANYNSTTGALDDETYYSFTGSEGVYNHFEGVTAVDGGFNLIATVTGTTGEGAPVGSALAYVSVTSGTFSSTADWTILDYPDSTLTTGNTVYENVGMGVYQTGTTSGNFAYTAIVPEPTTHTLIGAGLLSMLLIFLGYKRSLATAIRAPGFIGNPASAHRGTPKDFTPTKSPGPSRSRLQHRQSRSER